MNILKIALCLTVFICFFIFVQRPFEDMDCRRNRNMSTTRVRGVIKQKYKNTKNNNTDKIVTMDGSEFYWYDDFYGAVQPYKNLLIGDSIIKKNGSLEIEVYRVDTSFILNLELPCN